MLLTCPANRPHSAAQYASEEQRDCSDRQSAANSRLNSPILLPKTKCNNGSNTYWASNYLKRYI